MERKKRDKNKGGKILEKIREEEEEEEQEEGGAVVTHSGGDDKAFSLLLQQ